MLLLGALVLLVAFSRPLRDFVEYWTVAHVFVSGGNPYSLAEVFRREVALGWKEPVALMCVNPPWTLPLIAPLGMLSSYTFAWLLWSGALLTAILISSELLLDLYAPEIRLTEISDSRLMRRLFACSFYPALLVIRFAQVAPLILLGLALFLWLEKRGHFFFAGTALFLCAIKPQLVYLLFLAVILDAVQRKSWKTLAGIAWPIVLLTQIASVPDRLLIRHYLALCGGPYMQLYPSALGAILRAPFGDRNTFALQFLPSFFGIIWFAWYWSRQRSTWNWINSAPALITASVLTASWGWLFDQVLLVVPVVALFAECIRRFGVLPRWAVAAYTVLNVSLIIGSMVKSISIPYAIAPITFSISLWLMGRYPSSRSLEPEPCHVHR